MPLPFDFEGKGVLKIESLLPFSSYYNSKNCIFTGGGGGEPTSVLDYTVQFPSRPTSSSTLSSSDTPGVAAKNPSPKWRQDSTTATSAGGADNTQLLPVPPSLEIGGGSDKCAMEDWESVLSESVTYFMSDVEDPSSNLSKVLQIGVCGSGSVAEYYNFHGGGGFGGVVDHGFVGVDQFVGGNLMSNGTI